MSDVSTNGVLPPSSKETIQQAVDIEDFSRGHEQVDIATNHVIHAGIYTRTICVPAGVMITGALIKIPTIVTVSGHCIVLVGDDDSLVIDGFKVLPSYSNRKQVFIAKEDTYISMAFKTQAKTVDEAEQEFTDDFEYLKSRNEYNDIIITEV